MKSLIRCMLVIAVVASLMTAPMSSANAATDTNTSGRLTSYNYDGPCWRNCELAVPGRYVFRGTTAPSRPGQKVVFHYRKGPGHPWQRFDTGDCCGAKDRFNSKRAYDYVDADGRWKLAFTPWDVCCRRNWQLRAKFLRQGGYAPSRVIIPVFIGYFGD